MILSKDNMPPLQLKDLIPTEYYTKHTFTKVFITIEAMRKIISQFGEQMSAHVTPKLVYLMFMNSYSVKLAILHRKKCYTAMQIALLTNIMPKFIRPHDLRYKFWATPANFGFYNFKEDTEESSIEELHKLSKLSIIPKLIADYGNEVKRVALDSL